MWRQMKRNRQNTMTSYTASAPGEPAVTAGKERRQDGETYPVRRQLFRNEVIEFQRHNRQWGQVVPLQPLSTRLLVWFVAVSSIGIIIFMFVAQYARKETAPGYLAPVAGSARVFANQAGTIGSVYVKQGEMVHKGQPLLAVVTTQIAAGNEDVNSNILATLEQQKQALTRGIADEVHRTVSEQQRLTAQAEEHGNILGQLDAQMTVQRARIAIMEKMMQVGAQLRVKGLVSEVDQRHREETMLEQQQALISLTQQSTSRKGQLSEVRFNLAQLPFVQGERIQNLRTQLSTAEQHIAEVTGRSAYVVRSPIDGRISLMQAALGKPADPRRVQLQIVPNDSKLQAELFIPVRAIGFVEVGQDVRILYDSFPYQRFGSYHGHITKISETVLLASDVEAPVTLREPAYSATVALDQTEINANGRKIPLQPDMSLRADIILEKRTLVSWIFAPLRHLRIEG